MTTADTNRSRAVTAAGYGTLLWGAWNAVLGVTAIYNGIAWLTHPGDDAWWPVATLFGVLPVIVIVIGVAFVLYGVLSVIAGIGVLRRKRWGRILALILACLAVLTGAPALFLSFDGSVTASDLALVVTQLVYAVFALVVLATRGGEFKPSHENSARG